MFLVLLAVSTATASAQDVDPITRKIGPLAYYSRQYTDLIYKTANGRNLRLDLVIPNGTLNAWEGHVPPAKPTLIAIHGGGWIKGNKEGYSLQTLPFLVRGMAVINVEYRLAQDSLAPAAVEDCRCALRWVFLHAKEYGFDVSRVVVFGTSAGGHLSLMTGMLRRSDGFDDECPAEPGEKEPRVAAIVEFAGITNVEDLLDGPDRQSFALRWLGDQPNRLELAKRLSPVNYIRKDLPPILTVHGDADDVVPYRQATSLHQALDRIGASHQLVTVSSNKHGRYTEEELMTIYPAIYSFLEQHGILTSGQLPSTH